MNNYILDETGNPKIEPDLLKFAKWFEKADRHIGFTTIKKTQISTVFLGTDHNFCGCGKPILWETMIFEGKLDGYQKRYSSKEKAIEGHKQAVEKVKNLQGGERCI